jgi:GxxExxY protein
MEVHSALGPGLLESAYEACLCRSLSKAQIPFKRQVPVPITFEGVNLDCGFRLDLVVEDTVIVEIKSIDRLLAIHDSQILTYLKITKLPLGLLINFNVPHLRDGIRRKVFIA